MIALGLRIGLIVALIGSHLLHSLLYGTSSADSLAYVAVPTVLTGSSPWLSGPTCHTRCPVAPLQALRLE